MNAILVGLQEKVKKRMPKEG